MINQKEYLTQKGLKPEIHSLFLSLAAVLEKEQDILQDEERAQ